MREMVSLGKFIALKKEIMVEWKSLPLSKVKINSDGAGKGNPGAIGASVLCVMSMEGG